MNPLESWVDADEVRRLAARLIEPVHRPTVPLSGEMAGFSESFVGFAAPASHAPPGSAAPQIQPSAPARPSAPAELPPAAPKQSFERSRSAPRAFQSASGRLREDIAQFREWMVSSHGTTGMFILDRGGEPVFDDGSHDRLHFLARGLALAMQRPGAGNGHVHVKISADCTLAVIPVAMPDDHVVLGALVAEPLSQESAREAAAAIRSLYANDRQT